MTFRTSEDKKMREEKELSKLDAEIAKLIAETLKINTERQWLPIAATAGIFAAALGFLKLMALVGV